MHENVKPKQIEAVLELCKGKDVFVSLQTGYAKTLIFAVLPLLFIRQALFAYAAEEKENENQEFQSAVISQRDTFACL